MIINLSCAGVQRNKLENEAVNNEYYKKVEQLKRKLSISSGDEAFLIFLNLTNELDKDVQNISFKILLDLKSSGQFELTYTGNYSISTSSQKREPLFDVSGFEILSITISDVSYFDVDNVIHEERTSNTPMLINTHDIQNPYFGCRNEKELNVRMIFETYLNNGFAARGLMLKTLFKVLKEANETKFLSIDPPVSFDESNLEYFRGVVQVEIISKIMMYTEDLQIL